MAEITKRAYSALLREGRLLNNDVASAARRLANSAAWLYRALVPWEEKDKAAIKESKEQIALNLKGICDVFNILANVYRRHSTLIAETDRLLASMPLAAYLIGLMPELILPPLNRLLIRYFSDIIKGINPKSSRDPLETLTRLSLRNL